MNCSSVLQHASSSGLGIYGYEQKLFYSVASNLQSIALLFWLFVGTALLSSLAITRRRQTEKLK